MQGSPSPRPQQVPVCGLVEANTAGSGQQVSPSGFVFAAAPHCGHCCLGSACQVSRGTDSHGSSNAHVIVSLDTVMWQWWKRGVQWMWCAGSPLDNSSTLFMEGFASMRPVADAHNIGDVARGNCLLCFSVSKQRVGQLQA